MTTYYFYFALFVMTANFGYAFAQLGKEKTEVFSISFFLVTVAISAACLFWIQKRFAAVQQRKKEANQVPETTRGK